MTKIDLNRYKIANWGYCLLSLVQQQFISFEIQKPSFLCSVFFSLALTRLQIGSCRDVAFLDIVSFCIT